MAVKWIVSKGVWEVTSPTGQVLLVTGGSREQMASRYPGCTFTLKEVLETSPVTR